MTLPTTRPVVATLDLEALAANIALIRAAVAPARLCMVIKADAYGHGAALVAHAAAEAGADCFAVALVEEGIALRTAGITTPVLVLAEPPPAAVDDALRHDLALTVYSDAAIAGAESAARRLGRAARLHLKVDTGMHRVGAAPTDAPDLARRIAASRDLVLEGLFTHFAVADEPDDPFTALQLERFLQVRAELGALGITPPLVHAANSAAAFCAPATRLDLVRCGIACYGYLPLPALARYLPPDAALRPVLGLSARVHLVRKLEAGERPSYGRRYLLERPSDVAVVPIGYADGVPRALGAAGGEVLIRGRRRPIAGTVTMDQLLIDCGPDGDVAPGDEVVLLGRQGDASVSAQEWAERTGTIVHEILTSIGPRVPRVALPATTTAPQAVAPVSTAPPRSATGTARELRGLRR
jgi:alanine racemase